MCDCVLQFLQVEGGGRGCATTRPRKHRKCKKHIPPIHISKPHKTMECVRTRSPGLAHTFAQVVSNFPSEYLTLWSSYGKFIEKAAFSRFSNAANLLAEELRRQITAVCGGKKLLEARSTSRKGARVCVCVCSCALVSHYGEVCERVGDQRVFTKFQELRKKRWLNQLTAEFSSKSRLRGA